MSLHVNNTGAGTPTVHYRLTGSDGHNLGNINCWTMMGWARFTNIGIAYMDLFAFRSWSAAASPAGTGDGNIIGLGLFDALSDGVYKLNIGDVGPDTPDTLPIAPDTWHHYAITATPDVTAGNLKMCGYLDGQLRVETVKSTSVSLGTVYGFVILNSRESDTDWGAVWPGDLCAFKMWNDVVLSTPEVQAEMWSYMPCRLAGLYAVSPMVDQPSSAAMFGGSINQAWTTRGTAFLATGNDPPGVSWDAPMVRRNVSNFYVPRIATLTGTALAGITEADIVAGGKTIIVTLSNDTFIAN